MQPKRQVGGSGGGETTPGPLDEPSGGVFCLSSKHRWRSVATRWPQNTPATHTTSLLPFSDPFISLTSQVPVSHKELYQSTLLSHCCSMLISWPADITLQYKLTAAYSSPWCQGQFAAAFVTTGRALIGSSTFWSSENTSAWNFSRRMSGISDFKYQRSSYSCYKCISKTLNILKTWKNETFM